MAKFTGIAQLPHSPGLEQTSPTTTQRIGGVRPGRTPCRLKKAKNQKTFELAANRYSSWHYHNFTLTASRILLWRNTWAKTQQRRQPNLRGQHG